MKKVVTICSGSESMIKDKHVSGGKVDTDSEHRLKRLWSMLRDIGMERKLKGFWSL